jgi:hypothetical protein
MCPVGLAQPCQPQHVARFACPWCWRAADDEEPLARGQPGGFSLGQDAPDLRPATGHRVIRVSYFQSRGQIMVGGGRIPLQPSRRLFGFLKFAEIVLAVTFDKGCQVIGF